MTITESKISRTLQTNKFNPTTFGERKWFNYFISVTELTWARNFIDGYLINVYSDKYKSEHLASYTLSYDVFKGTDILRVDYEKE